MDPNVVKVVTDARQRALYFIRAPIPWHRDAAPAGICQPASYSGARRHIGIYAYRCRRAAPPGCAAAHAARAAGKARAAAARWRTASTSAWPTPACCRGRTSTRPRTSRGSRRCSPERIARSTQRRRGGSRRTAAAPCSPCLSRRGVSRRARLPAAALKTRRHAGRPSAGGALFARGGAGAGCRRRCRGWRRPEVELRRTGLRCRPLDCGASEATRHPARRCRRRPGPASSRRAHAAHRATLPPSPRRDDAVRRGASDARRAHCARPRDAALEHRRRMPRAAAGCVMPPGA